MVSIYTYLEMYLDDLRKAVSLSEFERQFKTPHQTVKSRLESLVKAKILLEDKRARFRFYRLNLHNPLAIDYLSLCEKEKAFAFLNKNALFSRLHSTIAPYLKESSVLLFGSAVDSKQYADIDLLIISKGKGIIEELKKFEKTYSVKLHIVHASESDLTETLITEIRKKHIIFNNHDYLLRIIYKNELGMV